MEGVEWIGKHFTLNKKGSIQRRIYTQMLCMTEFNR
jgi:hypothetical protein